MKPTRRARRAARQLYRLCRTDGVLDAGRVRQVAAQLAGSPRRGALAILADFQRLVRLDRDRHTALVESAAPLAPLLQQAIASDLAHRYGRVETSFAQNPALIGGLRIRVGSDVYDGSVRARLADLKARL